MIEAAQNTGLHFGLIFGENDVFEHFDAENAKVGFRIRVRVCRIMWVYFKRQATHKKSDDVLVHVQEDAPSLRVGEARGSVECAQ